MPDTYQDSEVKILATYSNFGISLKEDQLIVSFSVRASGYWRNKVREMATIYAGLLVLEKSLIDDGQMEVLQGVRLSRAKFQDALKTINRKIS
jgi:hypothetical protein